MLKSGHPVVHKSEMDITVTALRMLLLTKYAVGQNVISLLCMNWPN